VGSITGNVALRR